MRTIKRTSRFKKDYKREAEGQHLDMLDYEFGMERLHSPRLVRMIAVSSDRSPRITARSRAL
jgi:mRNA-degrading endonuclease YafQ of YafQ-DinJ toxin-antitoxin module